MVAQIHFWRQSGPGRTSGVTNGKILLKAGPMFRALVFVVALSLAGRVLAAVENSDRVIVSIREQKLMLVQAGANVATYPVSTSRFGLGDRRGSMATPLGFLQVAKKIGDHAPAGAVFHRRRFTGEVLRPNAPGRDPIVTRIIWLRGLERGNARAFDRCIYIHGTPQENLIGRPASYGCIRMKSCDVTALYNQLPTGALVQIVPDKLPRLPKGRARPVLAPTQMAQLKPGAKPAPLRGRRSAMIARAEHDSRS